MRQPLHLGGKRTGQSLMAVGDYGQKASRLIFVRQANRGSISGSHRGATSASRDALQHARQGVICHLFSLEAFPLFP